MLFGRKDKNIAQKPVYIAVSRTEKYFVDGVDVLDISNRVFLRNVKINITNKSFLAPLLRILGKTRKFNVVITLLFENVYAICFLTSKDYRKAHRYAEDSAQLNKQQLYEWSKKRASQNKQEGYLYSQDCSKRALITVDGNITKVELESLCLFPQVNASIPQSMAEIDKFVWIFEHENTSFYGDKDSAMQDLSNYFAKFE